VYLGTVMPILYIRAACLVLLVLFHLFQLRLGTYGTVM
jgi:hypothetical protein